MDIARGARFLLGCGYAMRELRAYRRFPIRLPFALHLSDGSIIKTACVDCSERSARLRLRAQTNRHLIGQVVRAVVSLSAQNHVLEPFVLQDTGKALVLKFDPSSQLLDALRRVFRQRDEEGSSFNSDRLRVSLDFITHMAIGTGLFLILYSLALLVSMALDSVQYRQASALVYAGQALKYFILSVDIVLYVVFTIRTSGRLMRRL